MSEVQEIPSKQIKDFLANNQEAALIDVRTLEEWNTIGKPDGDSINLPTHFISYQKGHERILNEDFEKEFLTLNIDKNKNILFICRSGIRSLHAAEIINRIGYNTFNVTDGFEGSDIINEPGWKASGLPCK